MTNQKLQKLIAEARQNQEPLLDVSHVMRYQPSLLNQDLKSLHAELWTLPQVRTLRLFPSYHLCVVTNLPLERWQMKVRVIDQQLHFEFFNILGVHKTGRMPLGHFSVRSADLNALSEEQKQDLLKGIIELVIDEGWLGLKDEIRECIKNLLVDHPTITCLSIDSGSPLGQEAFSLERDCNSMDLAMLQTRGDDNYILRKLLKWLERKAVHAIKGGRRDEISEIFDKSIELIRIYETLLLKVIQSDGELTREQNETELSHGGILAMNQAGNYPPLEEQGREMQAVDWMDTRSAEHYMRQWNLFVIARRDDQDQQRQVYDKKLDELRRAFSERLTVIISYTRSQLGQDFADWFASRPGLADINTLSGDKRTWSQCILSFSPNNDLQCEREPSIHPLRLAFNNQHLEVFKELLLKGADIFLDNSLLELLFLNGSKYKSYEDAVITDLMTRSSCQSPLISDVEQRLLPVSRVEGTPEQRNNIRAMMKVSILYLSHEHQLQQHRGTLRWFIDLICLKTLLQQITGTSTEQHFKEITKVIAILRNEHYSSAQVANEVKESLQSVRASIFSKRSQGHAITQLDTLATQLQTVINEDQLNAGGSAKLIEEARRRQAAAERYQLEREENDRRERENQERLELLNAELAAARQHARNIERQGHYNLLRQRRDIDNIDDDEERETYYTALRYLRNVFDYEADARPFNRLPHIMELLEQARILREREDHLMPAQLRP